MLRTGHVGVSMLVYAPVLAALTWIGRYDLAVSGFIAMILLSPAPDIDTKVHFLKHRGPTHTIWFALFVGVLCGLFGLVISYATSFVTPQSLWDAGVYGAFGFFIGFLGIIGHLVGDSVTPWGVRPFRPISDRKLGIDIVNADAGWANMVAWGLGAIACLLGVAVGTGATL